MSGLTSQQDELVLLRKRARRRLIGAIVMSLVASGVMLRVLDSKPQHEMRPETVDIVSNLPSDSKPATKPAVPAGEASSTPAADAPPASEKTGSAPVPAATAASADTAAPAPASAAAPAASQSHRRHKGRWSPESGRVGLRTVKIRLYRMRWRYRRRR